MSELNYLDFDLFVERAEPGYTARAWCSRVGQASHHFDLPFSDLELENLILRLGRARRGVRRVSTPEAEAARTFGGKLLEAVFGHDVRGCFDSSLHEARRLGAGLRIRLRLVNVPELADLPWEYLYNASLNQFFALSVNTPLVRYLDLPELIQPLSIEPPLRVLVMISSPEGCPSLDVEREWAQLKEAVRNLEQQGRLILERLEDATPTGLQRQLRRDEYHIFHFVGHGAFDERAQDGILMMEDDSGRRHPVSGEYLGTLLHDEPTLRLAILNACEGARTSSSDPFAGTAQSLVQQGVPAVIAMQSEISDEAAIILAREFYGALADAYPVDAALSEARKAIRGQTGDVEWGTPVLHLRAPDGHIFDFEPPVEAKRPQIDFDTPGDGDVTGLQAEMQGKPEPDPLDILYREAQAAMAREGWNTAIGKLQKVLEVEPANIEAAAALKKARQEYEVAVLYAQGQEAYGKGHWQEALECFRRIQDVEEDYRDVQTMVALAEEKLAAVEPTPTPPPPEPKSWRQRFASALSMPRGWFRVGIPAILMLALVLCSGGYLMGRWLGLFDKPTPTPTVTASPTPVVIFTPTATTPSVPGKTRTPTVTASPEPVITLTPVPIVTHTPTPVPECMPEVSGLFADLWAKYQGRLGCPIQGAPVFIVDCELEFENGRMFYRADNDRIYVLYGSGMAGLYEEFPDPGPSGEAELCKIPPPTNELFQPKSGFGTVWCSLSEDRRQEIGWAVNPQEFCFDNENGEPKVQDFKGGLIFRDSDGKTQSKAYVFFFEGLTRNPFVRESY